MTTPQPQPADTNQTCCGGEGLQQPASWMPKKGEKQVAACGLCKLSGWYQEVRPGSSSSRRSSS